MTELENKKTPKDIEIDYDELEWYDISDSEKKDIIKRRLDTLELVYSDMSRELRKLDEDKDSKKLSIDIPESPFDGGKDWEIEVDTERGFDDEDEELTDEEINDLINYQFNDLDWNDRDKKFDDLMKEGHPHTQRGFYCYVISKMSDEQLQPYVNEYVDWLERMNYKNEINKLPSEVKQDKEVMDLRKKQIEDDGKRIGNQVVDDLMSYFRDMDSKNETN